MASAYAVTPQDSADPQSPDSLLSPPHSPEDDQLFGMPSIYTIRTRNEKLKLDGGVSKSLTDSYLQQSPCFAEPKSNPKSLHCDREVVQDENRTSTPTQQISEAPKKRNIPRPATPPYDVRSEPNLTFYKEKIPIYREIYRIGRRYMDGKDPEEPDQETLEAQTGSVRIIQNYYHFYMGGKNFEEDLLSGKIYDFFLDPNRPNLCEEDDDPVLSEPHIKMDDWRSIMDYD